MKTIMSVCLYCFNFVVTLLYCMDYSIKQNQIPNAVNVTEQYQQVFRTHNTKVLALAPLLSLLQLECWPVFALSLFLSEFSSCHLLLSWSHFPS